MTRPPAPHAGSSSQIPISQSVEMPTPLKIAIIGAGPAGLTCGLALARRGIDITIVERGANHLETATYNPNRSYTIDITGHGKKATLLWRPYRACKCFTAQTQGDALVLTHILIKSGEFLEL
jgi:choline dehydrogenase-like flavoprotein